MTEAIEPSPERPRLRFAPSPTGALHLGSALVAVANRALASALGGDLVLRIDDTDAVRSRDSDAADLLRLLEWLGIPWDAGPVHQAGRGAHYRSALDQLLERGDAYPCFCGDARLAALRVEQEQRGMPPRYDGRCRALAAHEAQAALDEGAPHVLRFAVPEGRDVTVDDLVHGRVVVPAGSFGDPVLCRADGSAGYLLASVVDDIDLRITHVVRGEDHLPNAARQLLLFEALGARPPEFAHLPLLRDTDGRKLSKRDPLGTLDEVVDEAFLPVTVRRYLAELLGQGAVDPVPPGGDGPGLRLERIPTGAPKVDRARLESLGREDMAALPLEELLRGTHAKPNDALAPLVTELAASAPSRVALRGELRLVLDGPGAGDLPLVLRIVLPEHEQRVRASAALSTAIRELEGDVTGEAWPAGFLARYREAGAGSGLGTRDVLRPLRVALTGTTGGPGLELVLAAIGSREARRRVELALSVLAEELSGNPSAGG